MNQDCPLQQRAYQTELVNSRMQSKAASTFAIFRRTWLTTRASNTTAGTITELSKTAEYRNCGAALFDPHSFTGRDFALEEVKLLAPCVPPKILAVGLNYKSHLGTRPAPSNPEIFYKPVSCLQNPGDPIHIPAGAEDTHFEGELVIVIGRPVHNASREDAEDAVFGVTCGNDVSDRNWQRGPNADRQWWRAKGCDTFGPLGPWIVTGLNYGDLALANARQRRSAAGAAHQRSDLRRADGDLLCEPVRQSGSGRLDLHGHAGEHKANAAGRCG